MAARDPENKVRHGLGFERLVFFSDAVFAIAITLLVLDLKPGPGRFSLAAEGSQILAFGVSFYVIGRYWLVHHALFEGVHGYDRRLLTTNLLFLAAIAFLPFPTGVVARWGSDEGAEIFYTLSLAFVGVALLALVFAVRRPGIMEPGQTRGGTVNRIVTGAASPVVFCLAAAAAPFMPRGGALWCLLLLFPVGYAAHRLGDALERRIDGAARAGP